MGRASIKDNKNIYQIKREELGLTREEASELCPGLSPEKIEKIENEKCRIYPDDVMIMAEGYKCPELCNYYCAKECAIGQKYAPDIKIQDLSQIVLKTIASLNTLEKQTSEFVAISADGVISDDEIAKFVEIENELEKMSATVATLQLWTRDMVANGKINKDLYEQSKNK